MPRTLLVVDDIKVNREILKRILEDEFDVLEAENGQDALAIMRRSYRLLSAVLLDITMPHIDRFESLRQMQGNPLLSQLPVIVTTGRIEQALEEQALALGANDVVTRPYNAAIIKQRIRNTINLRETAAAVNVLQRDRLTGLYNRETFFARVTAMTRSRQAGYYVLCCFDINNFKVINDQYGSDKGDQVLRFVANRFRTAVEPGGGVCCRVTADNFALLCPRAILDSEMLRGIWNETARFDGSIPAMTFSIGEYLVDDLTLSANAMYDRAHIAKASVKGRYDVHTARYDESMREAILYEQAIVNRMNDALRNGEFEPWLQPQYNQISGALIGAEALVRWRQADGSLVPPDRFVPVFERNGFIYQMDKYIWEQVCICLRRWVDAGGPLLPVSVNISRHDLFHPDFYETLTGLVETYRVPVPLLRLEVTESAFAAFTDQIVGIVKGLVQYGFTVEIDDFGSGYSSLNTLKDVPATILKLDMKFLESSGDSQRGGNILESVVRMAKWLGMSAIAEGVETAEQAEFLKSIGCRYVQGYLYARPMPVAEYETLAAGADRERRLITLETVQMLDSNAFWDPKSMDTLIFNSYVGGACIFECHQDRTELLRVNDRYLREIAGDAAAFDAHAFDVYRYLDERDGALLRDNIRRAIETGAESTCECCLRGMSAPDAREYIRVAVRMIARAGDRYLLYASVFNVTAQREAENREHMLAEQMRTVMNDTPGGFVRLQMFPDGRVVPVYVNEGFGAMVGTTPEQALERFSGEMRDVHPDDRDIAWDMIARTRKTGEAHSARYRIVHTGGGYIWVTVFAKLSRTDADNAFLNVYYADAPEQAPWEEQQKELLDSLPCGAALYEVEDGRLRAVHLNRRYRELVGRSIGNAAQLDPMAAIHPDDRAVVDRELLSAMEQGRDAVCDIRIRCEKNGYRLFRVTGSLTRREDGRYAMYASYMPVLENSLSFSDTLRYILEAILESSTDLAFAKDTEFRYLCCSQALAVQAGLADARDVVGKTDYDLYDKEHADRFRASDVKLLEDGRPMIDVLEAIPSSDGVQHYASTSKYLLRDTAGRIIGLFGVGRDVTESHAAFEQLRLLTNSIPGGIAAYELTQDAVRLLYFSDGYCRHTGFTREEYSLLARTDSLCLVFEEDMPTIRAAVARVLAGDETFRYEYRSRSKDGGYCWLDINGVVIERCDGVAVVNVVKQDITDRKKAEEQLRISEEQFRIAAAVGGMVVARYNIRTGVYTHNNSALLKQGFGNEIQNVPQAFLDAGMVGEETVADYRALYDKLRSGAKSCSAVVSLRAADGAFRWMNMEATVVFDADGKPSEAIVVYHDITRQREQERALRQRAEIDGMTGVYNKAVTELKIRERLAASRDEPCVFLIADVDNLKTINDTHGHPQGDRAIRLLAEAMDAQFRKTDIVGRVGGDEFAAYLDRMPDGPKLRTLMSALLGRVSALRIGDGDDVPVCVSIGVATGQTGQTSFDHLYEQADRALYLAKGSGKKQIVYSSENKR